jgi:hypothetical protein
MNNQKQEYMERVRKYQNRICYEGFGESHHLREWARRLGVPAGSLCRYLLNGLTIEEVAEVRNVDYKPKTIDE